MPVDGAAGVHAAAWGARATARAAPDSVHGALERTAKLRTKDENRSRGPYVEADDIPGRGQRNDQLTQCRTKADLELAAPGRREMTAGDGAKHLDGLEGPQGVFDSLRTLERRVGQATQVCGRLGVNLALKVACAIASPEPPLSPRASTRQVRTG